MGLQMDIFSFFTPVTVGRGSALLKHLYYLVPFLSMVPSKRNVCLQLDVLSFSLPSHPKHVSILHSSHIHHIFIHTSFFITQPRVEQYSVVHVLYCTVLYSGPWGQCHYGLLFYPPYPPPPSHL